MTKLMLKILFCTMLPLFFEKKSFIDQVTPSLNAIMEPIITAAINEAVTQAVTRLEQRLIKPLKLKIKESEENIKQKEELLAQNK